VPKVKDKGQKCQEIAAYLVYMFTYGRQIHWQIEKLERGRHGEGGSATLYWGSGLSPQRGPDAESLVRGRSPLEAESILAIM